MDQLVGSVGIEPTDGAGKIKTNGLAQCRHIVLGHPPAKHLAEGIEAGRAVPLLQCASTGPSAAAIAA